MPTYEEIALTTGRCYLRIEHPRLLRWDVFCVHHCHRRIGTWRTLRKADARAAEHHRTAHPGITAIIEPVLS